MNRSKTAGTVHPHPNPRVRRSIKMPDMNTPVRFWADLSTTDGLRRFKEGKVLVGCSKLGVLELNTILDLSCFFR